MNEELKKKINYYYNLFDKFNYNIDINKKKYNSYSFFNSLSEFLQEKNIIINIYGTYSVGKTTLSLLLSGILSKKDYIIYYFDCDGSINLDIDIKRCNINPINFILLRINEFNDLLDIIFNKLNYDYNSFVIIDSFDSINNINDLNSFFIDLIKLLTTKKISFLIINQMRKIKIGPFYSFVKTFDNINFFSSIILKLIKKDCYILKNDVIDEIEIKIKKGIIGIKNKYYMILKNGVLLDEG